MTRLQALPRMFLATHTQEQICLPSKEACDQTLVIRHLKSIPENTQTRVILHARRRRENLIETLPAAHQSSQTTTTLTI